MDRIDTIEQFDPICAPIYKSPKYLSLFFDYDNATVPQIENQAQSILIEFGPQIGWKNAIGAIAPLVKKLKRNAIESEMESIEYLSEKELGGKQNRRTQRFDMESLFDMGEDMN